MKDWSIAFIAAACVAWVIVWTVYIFISLWM